VPLFDKILIANRGEIACRIIRTCRRLGIASVAVYSDADAGALHVRMADEAVHIGGPAPADSYLRGERILQAARATGAQAIHPGYGFLSENADFAEAVAAAGLVFIGPRPESMRRMGSKAGAKELMAAAGVPVVPGYTGQDQSPQTLLREAARIGFPLMIKAAHGGGGKGMRVVHRLEDFPAALESCQREARGAFGRDRVLLERYIASPRHIEVQVFGDAHGNLVHLHERECSAQRRYQKVLEESPSPFLTPERRQAMGQAAVAAARAIDYVNAGTVEFIVDGEGAFWFMEINTRLQVEHPVTEMVTGLDLVEWQLRVAAGEPLPLRQERIAQRGHAIEVRLYAEDPEAGFLPASGTLRRLVLPTPSPQVRVDAGVEAGDTVSVFYDPMIAKLIVHDADRPAALARLREALAASHVAGTRTNLAFLEALVRHPAVVEGRIDTATWTATPTSSWPRPCPPPRRWPPPRPRCCCASRPTRPRPPRAAVIRGRHGHWATAGACSAAPRVCCACRPAGRSTRCAPAATAGTGASKPAATRTRCRPRAWTGPRWNCAWTARRTATACSPGTGGWSCTTADSAWRYACCRRKAAAARPPAPAMGAYWRPCPAGWWWSMPSPVRGWRPARRCW